MSEPSKPGGAPRVLSPQRGQVEWRQFDLEGLIAEDHVARVLWDAVETLELSEFYAGIAARESMPGRPMLDPKLLLGLWLLATREGVGSARQLAQLCTQHHAYIWMCGGVQPNYHTLSDFRTAHGDKLDRLRVQVLASLMRRDLVKLERVAQDGMRTRASAGAASFRSGAKLKRCVEEAKQQIATLRRELEEDPSASSDRQKRALQRATEDRQRRLQEALSELPRVAEVHARNEHNRARRAEKAGRKLKASEPRVSTTDPEARVMKMPDGGYRPAYNVQLATDVASRFIVGVDVTNEGADSAQLLPMLRKLEGQFGRLPNDYLVDGGFGTLRSIDGAEKLGVKVYAPVPPSRRPGADRYARKYADTDRTFRWRRRMSHANAKRVYRQRAATAETVNADLRNRTMSCFTVRGRAKVRAVALLAALTYNLLRAARLRALN
jgi:transposase